MQFAHQACDRGQIAGAQGFHRSGHPRVLADDMPRALHPRTRFDVGCRRRQSEHLTLCNNEARFFRDRDTLHFQRAAIEIDGIPVHDKERRHLVEKSAAHPGEAVFRLLPGAKYFHVIELCAPNLLQGAQTAESGDPEGHSEKSLRILSISS